MSKSIENHYRGCFIRSYGKLSDKRIDASMLGLVYPADLFKASDKRMTATVKEIENRLVIKGGVHRYEDDEYDGWMRESIHRRKGAGAWPILNLW